MTSFPAAGVVLKEAGITPIYLVDRAAPPACLFEDGLAQPAYAKKGYRGKRPLLTLVDSGGNTAGCYFHFKRVLAAHKEQRVCTCQMVPESGFIPPPPTGSAVSLGKRTAEIWPRV